MTYKEFLERKIDIAPLSGIEIDPAEVSPALKYHQLVSVLWALREAFPATFGGLIDESEVHVDAEADFRELSDEEAAAAMNLLETGA